MSALVVGGVVVKVALEGVTRKNVEVGEHARAFDGSPVSDISDDFAELVVPTVPLSPADTTALRAALRGSQPVACSGDLLGGSVNCDVELGEERAVKAKDGPRWVIHFTLRVA